MGCTIYIPCVKAPEIQTKLPSFHGYILMAHMTEPQSSVNVPILRISGIFSTTTTRGIITPLPSTALVFVIANHATLIT